MDEEKTFPHEQHEDEGIAEVVAMPALPLRLVVNTPQQFKAMGDPLRMRILRIIQQQPATAKQIANRLGIAPGTIGHHLQVLEAAGLAQVVAQRIVHGIVAKYYARTAHIFVMDFPEEVKGHNALSLKILNDARDEMYETYATQGEKAFCRAAFPHASLTPERVQYYEQRINQLVNEFLQETQQSTESDSQVYGLFLSLFLSPPYAQRIADNETER